MPRVEGKTQEGLYWSASGDLLLATQKSAFHLWGHPGRGLVVRIARPTSWEVLNGVGVDGVGGIFSFFFFSLFFVFLRFFVFFFRFSSLFFVFLRFSGILLEDKGNDCNLLQRWGTSLRPRLHRPRAKLPEHR